MPSRGTAARARAVGMGVAVAALLVACGGGGSSGPTPPTGIGTVTPRATPTASPTPTEAPAPETIPPERPAALDGPGVEGAEALARYFLDLYPYVYATGDLTEWKSLSHPECGFCASVVDNVNTLHREGGSNTGSVMTWDSLTAWHIDGTRYGAEGSVTEGPSTSLDASGGVIGQRETSAERDVVYALDFTDAGWKVLEVDVDEADAHS